MANENMDKLENLTQEEVESLLDAGRIYLGMTNGRWWQARRNGQTQTWKTRPGEWQIPVKAGLRVYGKLRHDNYTNSNWFRIKS